MFQKQVGKIKNKEHRIKRYYKIDTFLIMSISVFPFVKLGILTGWALYHLVPTDYASMMLFPKAVICPQICLCTNNLSAVIALEERD